MGIKRQDKEKRQEWMERGFRFFDAPAAIVICTDKVMGETWPLMDVGAVTNNICLAALAHGLGTCIEDQDIMYPQMIRRHMGISESKNIVIGIALGYPDPDFPANKINSGRPPLAENTTWLG